MFMITRMTRHLPALQPPALQVLSRL